MFSITPNPVFTIPVQISVPGEAVPATITVRFKHKNKAALKALGERIEKGELDDPQVLTELVDGWQDVDQPYSREALEALLNNYPASAGELLTAWRKAISESRVKN